MFDALYIAATGMQAQQLNVDTIANNLANVNTNGFKKGRVSFTDLVSVGQKAIPTNGATADWLSASPNLAAGVGVSAQGKLFDAGALKQTGSSWDLAINGDGFLQVTLADGSTAYTRGGTLKVNPDGQLVTASGQPLQPSISVPANATGLAIAADGTVTTTVPGQSAPAVLGQLQLARFANPAELLPQGDDLYRSSDGSGEPIVANAGQNGTGSLQQGYLEGSNVTMVDEMVNLMVAQRAYEASVKVIQASDELLGMINNLRK